MHGKHSSCISFAIYLRNRIIDRYAACFLSIAGGSPSGPMLVTWGADNAAPDTVKAVTTALIPGLGAIGSIIACVASFDQLLTYHAHN